ncbi:MAG: dNTP triphosphohydrolase [Bacilli bacterium]|nr:dNTP triphosphohydrolase [Bacilli bacterium]
MSKRLNWNQLLSNDRDEKTSKKERKQKWDNRIYSKVDFDKVCFMSSFRRLQDKAQIFPLEKGDFVRSRLTHSIEAMTIAESIGNEIINIINHKEKGNLNLDKNLLKNIPYILKTAALIHDIGNPPFGHLGEEIIKEWFKNNLPRLSYHNEENAKMLFQKTDGSGNNTLEKFMQGYIDDFTKFDGNAQALRIVENLQNICITKNGITNGLELSYPLLATIIKYPFNPITKKTYNDEDPKKLGYFLSERELYMDIQLKLGLEHRRHPLVFALEAADDIAYLCSDLEDSVKKGLVDFKYIREHIKSAMDDAKNNGNTQVERKLLSLYNLFDGENHDKETMFYKIQINCAHIRGRLINDVRTEFSSKYNYIMNGTYNESLLTSSPFSKYVDNFIRKILIEKVYYSEKIVRQKIIARKTLYGLLDIFVISALNRFGSDNKDLSDPLHNLLISENFSNICKYNIRDIVDKKQRLYYKILLVLDYISGMTDYHAIEVYNIIR